MPGIMTSTMQEETRMYATSPDWYHWFKLVVPGHSQLSLNETVDNYERTYLNRRHLEGCRLTALVHRYIRTTYLVVDFLAIQMLKDTCWIILDVHKLYRWTECSSGRSRLISPWRSVITCCVFLKNGYQGTIQGSILDPHSGSALSGHGDRNPTSEFPATPLYRRQS
jgi:hypothetical protein